MNAYQPLIPPPDPSRRRTPRPRRNPKRHPHRAIVVETLAKLSVNSLLAVVAITALMRLLPYNLEQQSKLQELNAEVTDLADRVDTLQADLSRHFDPQQAMSVMQEQSIRVDPRQRQIVWVDDATKNVSVRPPQSASPHRDDPDVAPDSSTVDDTDDSTTPNTDF